MTTGEPNLYNLFLRYVKDFPEPKDCEVKGTVPAWLKGNLVRNGSAKFKIGPDTFEHAFDGMGCIHKWSIADEKVWYQNKLLESEALAKNLNANRIVVSEFGTACYPDPCKSIFQRYFNYLFAPDMTDNSMVSVMTIGDALYTLTETDRVNRIDPETLKTIDRERYANYVTCNSGTAHPHVDRDGTIYNLGITYGKQMTYTIFSIPAIKPGQENPLEGMSVLASIPTRWNYSHSYHHSFAMSENYIIYIEQPLTLNVLKLISCPFRGAAYSSALEFTETEKVWFHLVDKWTGEVKERKFTADAMFFFHQVNCYEDNGHIVLDLTKYNNADIIDKLYLKNLAKNEEIPQPLMTRYVLPLNSGKVALSYTTANAIEMEDGTVYCTPEEYEGALFELPRINYEDYNTKKYRYAYGVESKQSGGRVMKTDWETRNILTFADDDRLLTEPVFAANPDGKEEDDGVLLVPASSPTDDLPSRLYILDAKTLEEVAVAEIPKEIVMPFSFHGLFLPEL